MNHSNYHSFYFVPFVSYFLKSLYSVIKLYQKCDQQVYEKCRGLSITFGPPLGLFCSDIELRFSLVSKFQDVSQISKSLPNYRPNIATTEIMNRIEVYGIEPNGMKIVSI